MLPFLSSGILNQMRSTANDFMQDTVQVLSTSITYNDYGDQTVDTTVSFSGLGYVGSLTGSDRDLFTSLQQYRGERVGNVTSYGALVLLPFGTEISDTDLILANGYEWGVVWHNNDTMDAVQLYTKAIIMREVKTDEPL